MKICRFCGGKTENSTKICTNCGSQQFLHICPNCSTEFEGSFCPTCGTRYDAPSHVCPQCNTKFYSKSCPNCGFNTETRIPGTRTYSYRRPYNASGNSLVALIFAVIGLMTLMFPFSIVAMVLAYKEKKREDVPENNRKYARAAWVVSIIALSMNVLMGFFYILAFIFSMRS